MKESRSFKFLTNWHAVFLDTNRWYLVASIQYLVFIVEYILIIFLKGASSALFFYLWYNMAINNPHKTEKYVLEVS